MEFLARWRAVSRYVYMYNRLLLGADFLVVCFGRTSQIALWRRSGFTFRRMMKTRKGRLC